MMPEEWKRRKKIAVMVVLIASLPMVAVVYLFELLGWIEVDDR